MSEFENRTSTDGFTCKVWRGERMNLIGFDVAEPEPDLVGFSIEVKSPRERFHTATQPHRFLVPAGRRGRGNR